MAPSSENRERTAKACKALKHFGISAETVESALKRLLEAYENNWTYIEQGDYMVLIEAIYGPEEEAEPLKKESQTGFTSPASGTNYASEIQQTAETINIVEEDKIEGKNPKPQFVIPLSVHHPASQKDSCDDDSWLKRKKSVDVEDENVNGKENEDDDEIDIACSYNGEVKLSFGVCKPPEGFCVPSVDAVIKQVEDMYAEKFKGLGTEFSLSGILKDICDSLAEEGDV